MNEQPVETTLYSFKQDAPPPARRRKGERHLSLLRVGTLVVDGRRELCLIRNISAGGMMIRVYSKLDEDTRVAVELKQGQPISGTVRWTKDDCAGVTFDQPIDVTDLIATSMDGPRPRMPRVEVSCTAWVREDATVHRAKAADISQGGLKIACASDIALGAEVVVSLNGLAPTAGSVRWRDGDFYGITFHSALPVAAIVGWLLKQQQPPRQTDRAAG